MVEALTALSPPQTVTQLRQFIGLLFFVCFQFIKHFSRFMAPLYGLAPLKCSFIWERGHEDVRQSINNILTNDPVLMVYNPDIRQSFIQTSVA